MANLNLYIGGTPGGTDGTLIDPAAGIDLTGLYVDNTPNSKYIYLPLFIRCNPGFVATSVKLTALNSMMKFLGQNGRAFTFDSWSSVDNPGGMSIYTYNECSLAHPSSSAYELTQLGNTNLLLIACAEGNKYTTNILQNALSISYVETAV